MEKVLKFYFLPSIIIIVAFLQMFQVNGNLTKWKGGGFGMYSEYHFLDFEIWTSINKKIDWKNKETNELVYEIKRKPNKYSIINLLKNYNINQDTVIFQIWKPKLELPNYLYRRQLIYEFIAIRNIHY